MEIHDLLTPEKFDLMAYDQLNQFSDKMKGNPNLAGLVASMEAERPTVLGAAFYDDMPDPEDGGPGVMQLVKWNDEIYEFGLCEFFPYRPFLKTNDTSIQSVWACIAVFTDKSRKAGARTLMIRAGLPKP
jgi:hypothetical protein